MQQVPDGSGTLTATNNAVGATNLFYCVRVQDIDSDGLIFNNQGRRERLPWPPRPAVTGFKRQG